jgi:hypothetical protein
MGLLVQNEKDELIAQFIIIIVARSWSAERRGAEERGAWPLVRAPVAQDRLYQGQGRHGRRVGPQDARAE